jgi:hypothetical protein
MRKIHELTDQEIIDNITWYYQGALNAKQEFAGDWYREAMEECKVIARAMGVGFRTFVGVVAALSPQMNWKYNVREAVKLVDRGYAQGYGANVSKARLILHGNDPEDVLGGNKVRSFFRNLLDGGEDDKYITIDTWALRIALRNPGYPASGITDKQYHRLVKLYQHVADAHGISATALQAITWVHIRSTVNLKIGHTQLGLPL